MMQLRQRQKMNPEVLPNEVTEEGMVIEVRPSQPEKQ